MLLKKIFFKLPLFNIPFVDIKSLEKINYDYITCSSISIKDFMNIDTFLIEVYNIYDDISLPLNRLNENVLFGGVVSFGLPTRGKYKCIKINEFDEKICSEDLPDLKYSPQRVYSNEGQWYYMEKGNYYVFSGKEARYEDVSHLEGIAIYAENTLRLRVVFEMLKKNVEKGLIQLKYEDYLDIGFKVLRSDPSMNRLNDEMVLDAANNWIPTILNMPLYSVIPEVIRGKRRK